MFNLVREEPRAPLTGVVVRSLPMEAVVTGAILKRLAANPEVHTFRGDANVAIRPGQSEQTPSLMGHLIQSTRLDYAVQAYRATRDIPNVVGDGDGDSKRTREETQTLAPVPLVPWGATPVSPAPAFTPDMMMRGLDTIRFVSQFTPGRHTRSAPLYQAVLNGWNGDVDQDSLACNTTKAGSAAPDDETWAFARAHMLDVMLMGVATSAVPTSERVRWELSAKDCYSFPTFGFTGIPDHLPTAYTVPGREPGAPRKLRYVTGPMARLYGVEPADRYRNVTTEGSALDELKTDFFKRFSADGWMRPWVEFGLRADATQAAKDVYDGFPLPRSTTRMGSSKTGVHDGQAWSLVTAFTWAMSWHKIMGTPDDDWIAFGADYIKWKRTPAAFRKWIERDLVARRMVAVALQPAIVVCSMWGRLFRSPLLANIMERWGDPVKLAQFKERLGKIESLPVDPLFGEIVRAYGTQVTDTPWGKNQVVTLESSINKQLFTRQATREVRGVKTPDVKGAGWQPPAAASELQRFVVLDGFFREALDMVTALERVMNYTGEAQGASLSAAYSWVAGRLEWKSLPADTEGYPITLANETPIEVMTDGISTPPMSIDDMRHRMWVVAQDMRAVFRAVPVFPPMVVPQAHVPTNQEGATFLELGLHFSPLDWVGFHSPVHDFGDRAEVIELRVETIRRLGNWPQPEAGSPEEGTTSDPMIAEIARNPGAWRHLLVLSYAKGRINAPDLGLQRGDITIEPALDMTGEPVQYAFKWPGARLVTQGVGLRVRNWLACQVALVQNDRVVMDADVQTHGVTNTDIAPLRGTWVQVGEASK